MMRVGLAVRRCVLLAGLLLPGAGASALSRLEFSSPRYSEDGSGQVSLQSTTDFPFQGFSAAINYDPAAIEIFDVDRDGTILEALEADFFHATVDPENGAIVIGVLVNAGPTTEAELVPGTSEPVDLVHFRFDANPGAIGTSTTFRFVDGLGEPPIHNTLAVQNQSVRPEELVDGDFLLEVAPTGWKFVRGDANQDRAIDVTDGIFILYHLFLGKKAPYCRDAADVNDDEKLDITDPIWLYSYLFLGDDEPPAPFERVGRDRTGDRSLTCEWSAYGRF